MFGYVRPLKGELRVREYQNYRAVYCGLCHVLRDRGGFAARFAVNYDFTFLTMLLAGDSEICAIRHRCPANPFRRRVCLSKMPALETAADLSLVLGWWKLSDSVQDEGLLERLRARTSMLFLRRAYRSAVARVPEFDLFVKEKLSELAALEKDKCASIDQTADCFAQILRSSASVETDENRRRVLEQLLYHVGRMVYILDAVDDLEEDVKCSRYNPLIYRFPSETGSLTDDDRETLRSTILRSQEAAGAALQLLNMGQWSGILENIVYLGLPEATRLVLAGKWKTQTKIRQIGDRYERSL